MMMATTRGGLLLPCILSLLLLTAPASSPPTPLGALPARQPSAYEMLETFGFPRGILPAGVTGYTYRPSDGVFEVHFGRDCEFALDGGYRVTYRRTVSGNVERGRIRNLGGVSVRVFLLNWAVDRVVAVQDPERLVFYVGPISQAFPADGFVECPTCRCHSAEKGLVDTGDGVAAM